jgi:DNA-binding MarR family transcriptional regulator
MNKSGAQVRGGGGFVLPCACANLRKAALLTTQYYDEMLRASGVRATQFTLLQTLTYAPGVSQKKLAGLLGIDSTTLTRTLAFLRGKGWVRSETGSDRRELRHSLTAAGQREYKRVLPYWDAAQKGFRKAVGEESWKQMMGAAACVAGIKAGA